MAMNEEHKLRLQELISQLKDGTVSSTDAAREAAEIIFEADAFQPSEEKTAWRDYDEAITPLTIAMFEKLVK